MVDRTVAGGAAVDLDVAHHIHVVGVGGSGMSAIATILHALGQRVSGSDLRPSAVLDRLRVAGIETFVGHDPAHIGPADVVTRSTAIPDSNPELEEARRRGLPVLSRSEILAAITATRRTIAVAGTNGKTTTSSMLAVILIEAGLHPSYLVGGEIHGLGGGAGWSDGEWFVVEADESDGTFLALGAEVGVVTNVEPDHLEHYGGWAALAAAFDRFVAGVPGLRVVSADDPVAAEIGRRYAAVTFGTEAGADYRMMEVEPGAASVAFVVEHGGRRLGRVDLPMPGLHNARNACAAVCTAVSLGVPFGVAALALGRYGGVARRFELRGERDGVAYVDDYAHLPSEVAAAIAAARDGQWGRVVVAFQPHRYSRTADLGAGFADAFQGADVLALTDVYAAGEAPRPGVTGKLIVDAVLDAHPEQRVAYLPARRDLLAYLRRVLRPGDLCLTLGAGDVTTVADDLLVAESA